MTIIQTASGEWLKLASLAEAFPFLWSPGVCLLLVKNRGKFKPPDFIPFIRISILIWGAGTFLTDISILERTEPYCMKIIGCYRPRGAGVLVKSNLK